MTDLVNSLKREIGVSLDTKEVLELKEVREHLVFLGYQGYQGIKEI